MPRFRSRSIGWLLALLALRAGRAVDRYWLAGTLWPESPEETALHNLRDSLMHLRRALGPEAERIQSANRRLIAFAAEGALIDALEFDRGIEAGDLPSLARATAFYKGPLLEDCLEDWGARERDFRAAACLTALERLGEAAEALGDWSTALERFRQAERMDPLRDSIQRGLLRSLAESGDLPEATHAYREFRVRLHRELSTEPDPETSRLFQQLRARSAASDARRGDAANGEGRGVRRSPEAAPAVLPEPDRNATAPSLTLPAATALPYSLTGLIGREEELRAVSETLMTSRLVTVVGGGGLGKTRLAMEVGRRLHPDFASGAAFVALAGLSDPSLLPSYVAELLGVDEKAAVAGGAAIATHLGAAELLLILDNCEHLVDQAALLAQALLEQCPHVRVLTTSRQRLGIVGEVVWRISSLATPEEGSVEGAPGADAALREYPASQLLLERLEMVRPGFRVHRAEEALAVTKICRRLDGIPLALELAAARGLHLSVEEIADRLDDRFRLLTGGNRGVLPRHRTLRTLVDWSYDLLTAPQQLLLRRLAVFVDGWSLEAAEGVCAGWLGVSSEVERLEAEEVLDLLTGLVEQSMVHVEHRGGSSCYSWLETLREYALDRLRDSGEEAAVRERHRDYFLAFAESGAVGLGGREQVQHLEALQQAHGNLRAAIAFTREEPKGAVAGLRLAAALRSFWTLRGHYTEAGEHLRAALDRELSGEVPAALQARSRALYGMGYLTLERGFPEQAEVPLRECCEIFGKLEDLEGLSRALTVLGSTFLLRDRPSEAISHYLQSMELSRARGDLRGVSANLCNLGATAIRGGDDEQAAAYYGEALALAEASGDVTLRGALTLYLAIATLGKGDLEEAARLTAAAARILLPLNAARHTAEFMELEAAVSSAQGNMVRSLHLYGAAEALRHERRFTLRPLLLRRKDQDLAAAVAALGKSRAEELLSEGRAARPEQLLLMGKD